MVRALVIACLIFAAYDVQAAPTRPKLSPTRAAIVRGEDNAEECIQYNDNARDTVVCAEDTREPGKISAAFDAGLWQTIADHMAELLKTHHTPSVKAAFASAAAKALEARGKLGLSEAALRKAMTRNAETDKLEDHAD
jgi:hypothetical protein